MEVEKDYANLTDEEQISLLQASPDEGNTDNSPGFPASARVRTRLAAPSGALSHERNIVQPPQDPDWEPDPDQMGEWL